MDSPAYTCVDFLPIINELKRRFRESTSRDCLAAKIVVHDVAGYSGQRQLVDVRRFTPYNISVSFRRQVLHQP
jgi:hypothetical protein